MMWQQERKNLIRKFKKYEDKLRQIVLKSGGKSEKFGKVGSNFTQLLKHMYIKFCTNWSKSQTSRTQVLQITF